MTAPAQPADAPMTSRRARTGARTVLVAAIVLLAWSFAATVTQTRDRQRGALDARLGTIAADRTRTVAERFDRERLALTLVARDTALGASAAPTAAGASDAAGASVRSSLRYLASQYGSMLNEVCLIGATGAERARLTLGHEATPAQLSADESSQGFFAPALAAAVGTVVQTAPYRSPDTGEWVLATATPVPGDSGTAVGVLHMEITIESLRAALTDDATDATVQIVDRSTGAVLVDSRYPQVRSPELGTPDDQSYVGLAGAEATSGAADIAGQRVAFRRLPPVEGNANDWLVVASSPRVATGLAAGLSWRSLALAAAAVLLLALGGLVFRTHQRRLHRAATSDGLTGLANRNLLLEAVSDQLAVAARDGGSLALLLLDLDRFKEVNDTLGHQWGDELLRLIGPRISPVIRGTDMVARLGGDEFVVLLRDVGDENAARRVAERIVGLLEQPFQLGSLSCGIEASIGIAVGPRDGADVHTLMQHADVAMYVAKQNRFGVTVYEPALDGHNPRRLSLLGELRVAIEERQLVLHYQPKVGLAESGRRAVEALVRWHHPERGMVPPDDFIPLAEHTALIQPLTTYVIDEALGQCRRWLDAGVEVAVAVNVSARSLHDTSFFDLVTGLLARHGVPAELLDLEITESAIMADPKGARDLLARLHDVGLRISIDDFGTGYSSLAYLKTLPVDALKIDRSFVRGLGADRSDEVIVQSVIDLGRNLGLSVVAEGVEDQGTADRLTDLGCSTGQGWFWSKAVPADELTGWLTAADPSVPVGAPPVR